MKPILDRHACRSEEHRYGEEQGFWQEREVLLRRALDRTCCSRPVTYRGSGQEGHPN
jgi:hypothetical protein